jgi:hypothetical protein
MPQARQSKVCKRISSYVRPIVELVDNPRRDVWRYVDKNNLTLSSAAFEPDVVESPSPTRYSCRSDRYSASSSNRRRRLSNR